MTIPLTFKKVAPLPEDFIEPIEEYIDGDGEIPVPTRRLRPLGAHLGECHALPPSLNMKIGDCLGGGRTSYVFEIEPLNLPSGSSIPPLVAKFGRPGSGKFLLREAWFYDEMQTLQGEVIPWCYSLYCVRIPRGSVFLPWFRGESRPLWKEDDSELDKYLKEDEQLQQFVEKCARAKDPETVAKEKRTLKYYGDFKEEYAELVRQLDDSSFDLDCHEMVVPVLIMERLGKPYLPLGGKTWQLRQPIPKDLTYVALFTSPYYFILISETFFYGRNEVFNAFDRISDLGIIHNDIKYDNILVAHALSPPQPLSGEDNGINASERHRSYRCRVIDFELSTKSNVLKRRLKADDDSLIRRLISNLPYGLALGQNDL